MQNRTVRRIKSSLFTKIALVFFVSLLTVMASFLALEKIIFRPKRFPVIIRNSVYHAQFMADSIGDPPDPVRAREVSRKLHVRIWLKTAEVDWASHGDLRDFDQQDLPVYDKEKGIYAGFTDYGMCVQFVRKGYRMLLVLHSRREGFRRMVTVLTGILVSFSALILLGIFIALSWLLKPVRELGRGIEQVSEGNMDLSMKSRRKDELGLLTNSFGAMVQKIRSMIRNREQLLLDVSHELRSPLTRVKLALEFTEDAELRRTILEDVAEMETMVAELLESQRLNSRFGALNLESTDITALLQEMVSLFNERQPNSVDYFPAEPFYLEIDRERVRILLRNILENALRYSNPEKDAVKVRILRHQSSVQVRISDSGIGIPADEIENIFEPFYRVDKSRSKKTGGYGLGMNLCRKIMDAHKGKIVVESIPGSGTTVILEFRAS